MGFSGIIHGVALAILMFAAGLCGSAHALAAPGAPYDDAVRRLIEMGRDNLRQEEYGEALEMFESALVADPGSVEALIAIGDAYHAIERRDRSLRYYRQALQIEPNNRTALTAEAMAMIADGDVAGAEENLDRLRRICGEAGCPEIGQLENALATTDVEPESEAQAAAQAGAPDPAGDGGD